MPEIWTHELPMRWADLDMLNHVTNVVYVDYAAEAQAVLVRDGHLEAGRPVSDVTVTYLRPTPLSSRPLLLRANLDDGVLTQEVCTTEANESAVHATIVTAFGAIDTAFGAIDTAFGAIDTAFGAQAGQGIAPSDDPVLTRVRMTDLDSMGVVSASGQFRLAQESRIVHFARMGRDRLGQFVVGRIALQPLAPIAWHVEPLQAHSAITRVGRGSFTIDTMLSAAGSAVFTSQTTLVGFDKQKQSSRPFGAAEREHLLEHCVQ